LIVISDNAEVYEEVLFEDVEWHAVGGHVGTLHLFVVKHVEHLARQLSVFQGYFASQQKVLV